MNFENQTPRSCCAKRCREPAISNTRLCRLHYLKQSWTNLLIEKHEAFNEGRELEFMTFDDILQVEEE